MAEYAKLSDANVARQVEWCNGNDLPLSYAANELAGEVSEALTEAIFLIEAGKQSGDLSALAAELADVVICIELVALNANIKLHDYSDNQWGGDGNLSAQDWVNETITDLKDVCNTAKKLERERLGMAGSRSSREELWTGLWVLLFDTYKLAHIFQIQLDRAVAEKFNATSAKLGLETVMTVPALAA